MASAEESLAISSQHCLDSALSEHPKGESNLMMGSTMKVGDEAMKVVKSIDNVVEKEILIYPMF